MSRFAVGLDMSVRSSGCAIHDRLTDMWYLCAFAQNKQEEQFYYATSRASVTLFPKLPQESSTVMHDLERYLHIKKHFVKFLCDHITPDLRTRPFTCVNIEAYAFPKPEEAGHSYKLHESCGIVKYELFLAGFDWFEPIVCSSWKADVIGHGRATKLDVVQFMKTHGPCLDILTLFGYDETTLRVDAAKGDKKVPCPCQDLCDAPAIAMKVYTDKKTAKKRSIAALEPTPATKMEAIAVLVGRNLPKHKVNLKRRKQFVPKQTPFLAKTEQSRASFWTS